MTLCTALIVVSCNNGNTNTTTMLPVATNQKTKIKGPLTAMYQLHTNNHNVGNNILFNINWANGIMLTLFPEAKALLVPVGFYTLWLKNEQSVANSTAINSSFYQISQEIESLQIQLTQTDAVLAGFIQQQDKEEQQGVYGQWVAYNNSIYTTANTNISGVWNNFQAYTNNMPESQIAINSNIMEQLNQLAFAANNNLAGNNLASIINGLSNTQTYLNTNFESAVQYAIPLKNINANPLNYCATTTTATDSLVNLLCDTYQYFTQNNLPLKSANGNLTTNFTDVIPLFDDYNNSLMMFFQQAQQSLNAAYLMEETSAYLNYLNFLNFMQHEGKLLQIQPYENLPVLNNNYAYFSIGNNAQQIPQDYAIQLYKNNLLKATFNQIQNNLTQIYISRLDALYTTVMSYIISDPLIRGEQYIAPPASPNLILPEQENMYQTIPAAGLNFPFTGINLSFATTGVALYQYPGISQVYSYIRPNMLESNGMLNLSNFESAFPNGNQGRFSGLNNSGVSSLIGIVMPYPYTEGNNQTRVTNNIDWANLCGNNQNIFVFDYSMLSCLSWSNWATSGNSNQLVGSFSLAWDWVFNFLVYDYANPNLDNKIQTKGNDNNWYNVANNYTDNFHLYSAPTLNQLGNPNFELINAGAAQTYGSGAFQQNGSSFYNSGFDKQCDSFSYPASEAVSCTYTAIFQVTLPNQFRMPFYIVVYPTATMKTYLSPICPNSIMSSFPPGLSQCWQQDNSNGGIGFTTQDGNTYYINILQPPSGQGMQYGYLQLSSTPCSGNSCIQQ